MSAKGASNPDDRDLWEYPRAGKYQAAGTPDADGGASLKAV